CTIALREHRARWDRDVQPAARKRPLAPMPLNCKQLASLEKHGRCRLAALWPYIPSRDITNRDWHCAVDFDRVVVSLRWVLALQDWGAVKGHGFPPCAMTGTL